MLIAIALEDSAGRLSKRMVSGKGDTLALRPLSGEDPLDCGTYIIDKIDISAPPSTVIIVTVSLPSVSKALRNQKMPWLSRLRFPPSPVASRKTRFNAGVGKIALLTIDFRLRNMPKPTWRFSNGWRVNMAMAS